MLKQKSEDFETFNRFRKQVESESGFKLKGLHTDRGGEFRSYELNEYCSKERIRRPLTAPYSPQQKRVVEWRNRTILEVMRSLLKAM